MNIKYFRTVVMTVFLSVVSLGAGAMAINNVKISTLQMASSTLFTVRLKDLNGNPVVSDSSGNCVGYLSQFWVMLVPDQTQAPTGVSDREHFKMLYSLASAAAFAGNTVDVILTYNPEFGSCFLSGLIVKAD